VAVTTRSVVLYCSVTWRTSSSVSVMDFRVSLYGVSQGQTDLSTAARVVTLAATGDTNMKHLLALILAVTIGVASARAEVNEIRITRQYGIIYMAVTVMEAQKLVEKHAAAAGVPGLKATYITFAGGGAATDSLLSGNVDVVTTGSSNMLLLWDRTKGQVKGFGNSSATPMWLMSKNPKVKTIADLGPEDRIAVPTVKISTQAILLQMAARKMFGDAEYAKLDQYTTTLGHPDAMAALLSGGGGLTGHFAGPPFQQTEQAAGLHVVTTSTEIMGGPISNAVYFGTQKFHDANPGVVRAFMAAAREAAAFIAANPRAACEQYAAITGDKTPLEELVKVAGQPDMFYNLTPVGIMQTATHMADTKVLKTRAASWKDFFFPEVHDLPGN
jgi:NitT/TauT family transport system substrate-binding protein